MGEFVYAKGATLLLFKAQTTCGARGNSALVEFDISILILVFVL